MIIGVLTVYNFNNMTFWLLPYGINVKSEIIDHDRLNYIYIYIYIYKYIVIIMLITYAVDYLHIYYVFLDVRFY